MITLKTFHSLLAAIVCSFAVMCSTLPASAASCAAAGTVKNAASAFIGGARNGSAPAFASALARHADVSALAIFALGKYRDELPSVRRSEYVKNTHRYMSAFLASHAGRFGGGPGLMIESFSGSLVETSINGESKILWRVSGGRVQDVRISGVWLALQLRSKFTGIITRSRGDVTALLDYLARTSVAAM
jgi:hypothetical protein